MTLTHPSANPSSSESPIKRGWRGAVFLVGLLLISGITASVVGYKVKTADIERKGELLQVYESYGGTFEGIMTLSTTKAIPNDTSLKNIYVATYELNERARKVGLYLTLESTPPFAVDLAIMGLDRLGSKECYLATKEAWEMFLTDKASTPPGGVVLSASRVSKRYDRAHARDVEVKLYKLLTENRAELIGVTTN
jgi:hypothetical protein